MSCAGNLGWLFVYWRSRLAAQFDAIVWPDRCNFIVLLLPGYVFRLNKVAWHYMTLHIRIFLSNKHTLDSSGMELELELNDRCNSKPSRTIIHFEQHWRSERASNANWFTYTARTRSGSRHTYTRIHTLTPYQRPIPPSVVHYVWLVVGDASMERSVDIKCVNLYSPRVWPI